MKVFIGLALGFGIGLVCSAFNLPLPSPPILLGAVLVLCLTTGHILMDKFLEKRKEGDGDS